MDDGPIPRDAPSERPRALGQGFFRFIIIPEFSKADLNFVVQVSTL